MMSASALFLPAQKKWLEKKQFQHAYQTQPTPGWNG
jgi:hypothetical protein